MSEVSYHRLRTKLADGYVEVEIDGSVYKIGLDEDGLPVFPESLGLPPDTRANFEKAVIYNPNWQRIWQGYCAGMRGESKLLLCQHSLRSMATELGVRKSHVLENGDEYPFLRPYHVKPGSEV